MRAAGLQITLKRSKRKTLSIFIERDGSVTARVPEGLSEDEIARVLESKAYQIHRQLAQWTELNEARIEREYVSGQSFLYLGRNYRLKITEDAPKGLQLKNGCFLLHPLEQASARSLFREFYRIKLQEKIPPVLERYQQKMGVKVQAMKVMDLQNRWASCTAQGKVNFHWKCAMAPIEVLHYIVVHELAHLQHPNHTPAFWNEVDKVLPHYQDQLLWLKKHGAGMDL